MEISINWCLLEQCTCEEASDVGVSHSTSLVALQEPVLSRLAFATSSWQLLQNRISQFSSLVFATRGAFVFLASTLNTEAAGTVVVCQYFSISITCNCGQRQFCITFIKPQHINSVGSRCVLVFLKFHHLFLQPESILFFLASSTLIFSFLYYVSQGWYSEQYNHLREVIQGLYFVMQKHLLQQNTLPVSHLQFQIFSLS